MSRFPFEGVRCLPGARSAFTRAGRGAYKDTRPDDLLVALLRHCELGAWPLEDLIVGCAYPEGEQGYNLARMAALGAGLALPGVTVNRLCASSLEALAQGAARIACGQARCVGVAGVESMSRVARRGAHFSESAAIRASAPEAYIQMGETAERLAERFQIERAAQEDLAAESHRKAAQHRQALPTLRLAGQVVQAKDEFVRDPIDRQRMAQLPPAFRPDGSVTAATSSPLSDGAACALLLHATQLPAARASDGLDLLDAVVTHTAPEWMGLGPVSAIETLCARHGLDPRADIAAYEINEAFAVQMLAVQAQLRLPEARVNAWGGALALGHPLGATGLRLMLMLGARLASQPAGTLGIAALCVGGGQGMALLARRP